MSGWRDVRHQLFEARFNGLAHPDFDRDLPRAAVRVLTCRLVGGAAVEAQEYATQLGQSSGPGFEVWDRETLRSMMTAHPGCGLAGGSPGDLLALLGSIGQGKSDHTSIEQYSRRWTESPLQRVAVEAAVVAHRLRTNRRSDLAAITALALLRAALCQPSVPQCRELAAVARRLYATYAAGLLDRYQPAVDNPPDLVKLIDSGFVHVTYPVTCMTLAETWGLPALAPHVDPDITHRARASVAALLKHQPGAAHPISDRWAVSIIPAVLAAAAIDRAAVEAYLHSVVTWVADAYDNGIGLASTRATPADEVTMLLGPELEHIEVAKPATSYLATVLIDLAAAADVPDTYQYAVNELLAAGAAPTFITADEAQAKWGAVNSGLQIVPVVRYREMWAPGGPLALHHDETAPADIAAWDALALATLPRNRHHWWAIRQTLREGESPCAT
ncbi:hypothetical protein GA0070624_5450 [Micromonospora rhizosphaerae]|uniref:Uncharacterized protein n=1 Tax=Micromonospora rhizosphaerae TaxID=568872 RepID=A0A1C6T2T1_9ACTN|nr:hypothetical protein [Micromonospora rhizosphaerae]SCL36078.1 hypothetical protein GA0070624_5450 [Micromonospora rhizosphaerae]